MIEPTLGNPTKDGIYAARQYYGWRILEWHKGEWWHVGRAAKWPVGEPGNIGGIEAHVGPLPVISKDFTKPAPHRGPTQPVTKAPAQEFDL